MFSNPRLMAEYNDWPIGGANRGLCKFVVEDGGKKGKRVSRTTTDKHGRWCKPKYTTYMINAAIVDGDDGKTYIIGLNNYGFITVRKHDFNSPARGGIYSTDNDYETTLNLIKQAEGQPIVLGEPMCDNTF